VRTASLRGCGKNQATAHNRLLQAQGPDVAVDPAQIRKVVDKWADAALQLSQIKTRLSRQSGEFWTKELPTHKKINHHLKTEQ